MSSFVGRQRELQAVGHVMSGQGPELAAVVSGEAGIGKSRLVGEATDAARSRGVSVLVGRCLPLAKTFPLLPVGEALRGLAQFGLGDVVGPAVRALPAKSRAALAILAPGLMPAGGHVGPPGDPAGPRECSRRRSVGATRRAS